jgi:glycerophosphoryl diester phosphodiesterase
LILKNSRLKAALAIVLSAAVFAALIFLIVLAFQKNQASQSLKELSEKNIKLSAALTVTAQTGCLDTVENSYLSAKTGVNTGAQMISADISFNKDGVPVLAAELEDADKETAITLERVLEYLKDKDGVSMLLNIKQVTNLPALEALAKKYDMATRLFFTGANSSQAPYIISKCPSIGLYLEIEPEKGKLDDRQYCSVLAESALNLGVVGLNCASDHVSKTLVETVQEYGLRISVYDAEKEADFYRLLDYGVDNIITKDPKTLITVVKAIQAKNAMR